MSSHTTSVTVSLTLFLAFFFFLIFFIDENFPSSPLILPAPYLTSIEPTNGPASGGTLVTILGNSLGNSVADIVSVTIDSIPCLEISLIVDPENAISCVTGTKVSEVQVGAPFDQLFLPAFFNCGFCCAASRNCGRNHSFRRPVKLKRIFHLQPR